MNCSLCNKPINLLVYCPVCREVFCRHCYGVHHEEWNPPEFDDTEPSYVVRMTPKETDDERPR